MNTYQQTMFNDLESLIATNEAFFRQEFILDNKIYWIYNYRLASYTDFLASSAIECRGVMFEVKNGQATRLASLPMSKFFNYLENPLTMDVDLNLIERIEHKSDGSLISTYIHDNNIRLKTKGSLFSDQAIAAQQWLNQDNNKPLNDVLYEYAINDFTVNLEFVSPTNRIVLGYPETKLIVLNVRHNSTGKYLNIDSSNVLYPYMDQPIDLTNLDKVEFVNNIPNMLDDIEGFVLKLSNGLWMKVKTDKYKSLHHCKSSVNNPRRLYEVIIDEGIDDIRVMFKDDLLAIKLIDDMQAKVNHLYNHMVKEVEEFYEQNKELDRKEYAIKGQQELDKRYFGLAMLKFQNKDPEYKQYLKSKYKLFGIEDKKTELD
jgi:T4 RnlA family RNA ligase